MKNGLFNNTLNFKKIFFNNNIIAKKKYFLGASTLLGASLFYFMNNSNKKNNSILDMINFNNSKLECRDKEALKNISKTVTCYEPLDQLELEKRYPNLTMVNSKAFTNLLNQIREVTVGTAEFRKISKRLIRILLEEALAGEYTKEVIKESPCGYYRSHINPVPPKDYIAVSILRSGDTILDELLNIMPDVQIGKVLVQRNEESNDKEAIYFFDKLPKELREKKAIVVDPMIATGGSAIASIEILIKKGIKEENIIFVNIISCEEGIKGLFSKYPKLRIVSGVCDPELLSIKFIAPGLGDFGDRYYGTN